jgi:hypothetical protein
MARAGYMLEDTLALAALYTFWNPSNYRMTSRFEWIMRGRAVAAFGAATGANTGESLTQIPSRSPGNQTSRRAFNAAVSVPSSR